MAPNTHPSTSERSLHRKGNRRVLVWLVIVGIPILAFATLLGLGFMFPQQPHAPASGTDRMATALGSKIRYRERPGAEPTLIFLHGFAGSLGEWDRLIERLPGRRTISLDMIGFAGSDRPDVSYDLECHRLHVEALMNELDINRAVLVGRSMGASTAAWMAAQAPERVIATVLVAPSGVPGSMRYRWPLSILYRPGRMNRAAFAIVGSSPFRTLFPNSLARQGLGVTNSYADSFTAALGTIRQPTLLIWSPGDQRIPISYAEIYRREIPHLELVEAPISGGHGPSWRNPDETAAAIESFLSRSLN